MLGFRVRQRPTRDQRGDSLQGRGLEHPPADRPQRAGQVKTIPSQRSHSGGRWLTSR